MFVNASRLALATLLASSPAVAQDSWTGLRAPTTAAPAPFEASAVLSKGRPVARLGEVVDAPAPAHGSALPGGPTPVDDSALRYYASQNDTARVAAEIRRIRLLNPQWTPPQDLFDGVAGSQEEEKLWALFGDGKLEEIRTEMAQIQERLPNWRPSPDFVTKYQQAQARHDITEASNRGDHVRVIAVAEAQPALMTCVEMDMLWRVAEALVHTGSPDKAFELYGFILARCSNAQERLATVQKAASLLPSNMLEKLFSAGSRAGERVAFENARLDLVRRKMGEAIEGGAELTPLELKGFEAQAEQRRSVDDAMLVGWLCLAKKDAAGAARWFKTAMAYEKHPKAIEGYILSLRMQAQLALAEQTAYEARDVDPGIARLYVEILATELTKHPVPEIDPPRLTRLEAVTDETKSVTGSQALGWYLYNRSATQPAFAWFRKSVSWEPTEANVLGYALSAHKLKDTAAFKAALVQYGTRFPAVAALRNFELSGSQRGTAASSRGSGGAAGKLTAQAVALFKNGKYDEALAVLDKRTAIAKEDEGLALLRGWSLYHTGQWSEAKQHFQAMDARNPTRDTQYGIFYSNERLIAPQFRAD